LEIQVDYAQKLIIEKQDKRFQKDTIVHKKQIKLKHHIGAVACQDMRSV
jgi:hypothetical protein